jgi:crotonobetainyl-CoA:carnitine CoA-transferase CaiB-like acyl-CoA transferase
MAPLDGTVVIDLGQIYNGPYATLLLALAGATVIKVEPPAGDLLRRRGERVPGALYPFVALNCNKLGVTLNLKTERGRDLLLGLARCADVLVENFRPGVMERLGVGPDVVRTAQPRLVYASASGYGQSGPYRDYPAMDITVQAMSGVMSITGWADRGPVKAGPAIADFFGGVHLYGAIVTALLERERTGEGQHVDVAMLEAVLPSLMSSLGLYFASDGHTPLRTGNRHNGLAEAPYNVYPAVDGELALICATDAHWRGLVEAIGNPELADDERFADMAARVRHIDAVDEVVAAFTRTRTRSELFEALRRHGVPCAPVQDLQEVMTDPHLRARGALHAVEHPALAHDHRSGATV